MFFPAMSGARVNSQVNISMRRIIPQLIHSVTNILDLVLRLTIVWNATAGPSHSARQKPAYR